ncbi:MAG: 1-deoxy-D-xylulose-5-phosphate synthase, partial [Bacteroidales bacterium]|nr:1-deoxy-D-xylulose-5-phosphate synthase [Bacteroidales bacterium]
LPVTFCIDRAGIVGEDGVTHHGQFDLAYLREIPNMTIASPLDEHALRNLMFTAQNGDHGPFAIRYPRGKCEHTDWQSEMQEISIGKGRMLKDGNDIAVLSLGPIGNDAARAIDAAEKDGISAAHYDMVFLKPLDEELVKDVATKFKHIITVEDGCITGGLGTAVMECVNKNGLQSIVHRVGIPDRFVKQGTVAQLYKQCGMDSESIKELIISLAGDSKK